MAEHGNSNRNTKQHHLYEIRDSVDDDIFKYGISHGTIAFTLILKLRPAAPFLPYLAARF